MAMPAREVAAVGVAADLVAVAEDVQRVLALQNLLHEVGHDVAHRELDVAAEDVLVAERAPLADADAVERPADRVGQPVLLVGALREVFARRASGSRRCSSAAGTRARAPSGVGNTVGVLEHHRLLERTVIFCSRPLASAADRRVEGRGDDPLVFGQQVVGVLVEVARCRRSSRRRRRSGRTGPRAPSRNPASLASPSTNV